MVEKIAEFLVRRRALILTLFFIATAYLLYHAVRVPIHTYFPDLIPKHEFTDLGEKYNKFGGSNTILMEVRVKEGDIFNYDFLSKIIEISNTMIYIPGVNRQQVTSIGVARIKNTKITAWGIENPYLMYPTAPDTEEGIEELKKNIYRNTSFFGRLVSLDSKAALITASFFVDEMDYAVVYDALTEIRDKYENDNISIHIEGEPFLYGVVAHYLPQTARIFSLTVVAMLLVAYFFTGLFKLVLVPFVSMILCAIWGLGFIDIFGFNLDPMVLVIPLLISARALSHSLQASWRINEEYLVTDEIKGAVFNTMKGLMYPGMAGIITDGIGILLIAFVPVALMYKVGISYFVWALVMIFVVLVFHPLIYTFVPLMRGVQEWRESRKQGFIEGKVLKRIVNLSTGKGGRKRAWIVIGVAFILMLISGYITLDLRVGDTQPGSPLLAPSSRYNQDVKVISETFPGSMDPLIIVVDGKKEDGILNPNVMFDMERFQFDMTLVPEIFGTGSIADLVKNFNQMMCETNPKQYVIPDTEKGVFTNLFFLIGGGASQSDFETFYNFDYSAASITCYLKDHTADTVNNALAACRGWIDKMGDNPYEFKLAMGRAGLVAATNESVARDQVLLFVAALVLTAVFCGFFMKSATAGILLIIPLFLANLFTYGYMAYMGIGLNLQTLPVSTIAVGIGVDYGIYLMGRIKEEFGKLGDLDGAIKEGIYTAGNAITVTAVIIIFGVVLWNFSSIKFQADMGLLLSLVTIFHLFGTLLLLPALISVVRPKFLTDRSKGWEG